MLRVGLTGTVGAGKSTVGRLFEAWGACRIDADRLAREAVAPGTRGLEAVREAFGDVVLDAEGALDRAEMRRRVFGDAEARRRLEAIVHPEVRRLLEVRAGEARSRGCDVMVAEVPLLLEGEMEDDFDVVVVVDAPADRRRRWIEEERGVDRATFEAIEGAQWSAERKRSAADVVLVNDGTLDELEARAREVWEGLVRRVRERA